MTKLNLPFLLPVVLVALFLTGCAAPRLSGEADKKIRTVAIISFVPETARFEKIGLTVFNNEREEIAMGDQVTSTIRSVITRRLAVARPAWTVKVVSFDQTALTKRLHGSSMVMAYNEERIEKDLAQLAGDHQLDALLVVSAYKPENSHGDGVGVLLRTFSVSSIGNAYAHANVSLKIIDATGKIVAVSRGAPTARRIDPGTYGIQYKLSDNLHPQLLEKLRLDILENLTTTLNLKLDQLGM
jgi:hypothetical protein